MGAAGSRDSRPHDRRRFELELAGCRWHRADNPFAGALRNHVCGGSVLHEHEKGSQRVKSLKGKHPMHTRKQTLILVAAFGAALVAAPALYANDSHNSPDSTRKDGMIGGRQNDGPFEPKMEGCGAMMQGGRGGRPNDQWRKNAPAVPDKDS
jgi:hypothetical protein